MTSCIIFDLDGTLIDSSSSILSAFSATLSHHAIDPVIPLASGIIGPPLRETLSSLAGTEDSELLDELAATFKTFYDTQGYKSTEVFPGVAELLSCLWRGDTPLYIATNKRLHPTRLILEHLGWTRGFRGVYTLDCATPQLPNKTAMLAYLLGDAGINRKQAIYVGDKLEDGLAADANFLPFIAACWGYGALTESEIRPCWRALHKPAELVMSLLAPKSC